jgi:hypothetical protein
LGIVRVDLAQARLAAKITRRFDTLCKLAEEMEPLFAGGPVALSIDELARVTEAYFLLSEAYRIDVLGYAVDDARGTASPKKAALTMLAIFLFRPFRIMDPTLPLRDPIAIVANQILAMRFAASVLKTDFAAMRPEMQARLFLALYEPNLQSLRTFVANQTANVHAAVYDIELIEDLPLIELLIFAFETFWDAARDPDDDSD